MFRLQPTSITITAPELNDAERRSRYRTHLINRQRANRRHVCLTPSEQEIALQDAFNTRVVTPSTHSIPGPDAPPSTNQDEIEDEEESTSPEPSSDHEVDTSSEILLGANDGANTPARGSQSQQQPLVLRQRSGRHESPDVNTTTETGPLPIRTRLNNLIDESTEQDADEHRLTQLLSTAVAGTPTRLDTSPYESEEEYILEQSLNLGERVAFPRDAEVTTSSIAQELNATPPRRHVPVYSDRLPLHEQPQTPRQLPEARHQSRFDGAYTAPARGRRTRVEIDDEPVTVRGRRARRNISPVGLRTPGFRGLYGGSENADDV
ncbi:hypothetical protein FSARC_10133 [Fusarium sarcochroum]|uniref:Uncharacterized protein n=1 Tax=Fusarium sarcochroum TaxID=1208366 RepID=A0A8H4TPN3_9HYPO|nr:hypothetical protein FSARC_10133 [Fusarium sarcochroum]